MFSFFVELSIRRNFLPHHTWTCSAAPIKDPTGRVIGCLNMSGHYSLLHKHTLGMVVSAVKAIEEELSLQRSHFEALLANEYLKAARDGLNVTFGGGLGGGKDPGGDPEV